jgi:ribosome-associated translation inhibitor RaiA
MQIRINTDHNIKGHEPLAERITGIVQETLGRVADHITRVEVHLSIESGGRNGQSDKRCVMEARMEGEQPIAASENSGTLDQAVAGASAKLLRLVDSSLGRRRAKRHSGPDMPVSEPESPVEP